MLILACGNPLRGDDGVAWEIARALGDSPLAADGDVEIVAVHQLTPELAEHVSRAETAIFVDAAVGGRPGDVCVRVIEPAVAFTPEFTHTLGPAELLAIAREVFASAPRRAFLMTVSAVAFDFSETLSGDVRRAIPVGVEQINAISRGLSPANFAK